MHMGATATSGSTAGSTRRWTRSTLACCLGKNCLEGLDPSYQTYGQCLLHNSPWRKSPLHSSGDASRLTALLLGQICPIFSLVPPCQAGASPLSVQRGVSPRAANQARAACAMTTTPTATITNANDRTIVPFAHHIRERDARTMPCAFCRATLTNSNASREHVFPNALGGRRVPHVGTERPPRAVFPGRSGASSYAARERVRLP